MIFNDYEYLRFELEGVSFEGSSFYDFEILDYDQYSVSDLKGFSTNRLSCLDGSYVYEICDYQMKVFLPVKLKEIEINELIPAEIEMNILVGKSIGNGKIDQSNNQMTLKLLGENYYGEGQDFEDAANKISNQIKSKYAFYNCFGCRYSDYSYLGSPEFGKMLCFKNQKERYVKVRTKEDYLNLDKEDRVTQEIFVCNEYEMRGKVIGYRG